MTDVNQKLADFFGIKTWVPELGAPASYINGTAHLMVTLQEKYCGEDYDKHEGNIRTIETIDHIASILPIFRAAGFKLCWSHEIGPEEDARIVNGFLPKASPAGHELIIPQTLSSAFANNNLGSHLRHSGISRLLVSGFDAAENVLDTVVGALNEQFQVCVFCDTTDNSEIEDDDLGGDLQEMEEAGAIILNSREFLIGIGYKGTPPEPNFTSRITQYNR